MGISLRIFLPFVLFYCFKLSSAQTVQDVVTYTTKPVEELKCQFPPLTVAVQWTEQRDGGSIVLFSYLSGEPIPEKETNDTKYNNFDYHIDQDTNNFNLLITNVDKDDGGRYVCAPFSEPTLTYGVSVEVLPSSININCTELNVCSSSSSVEREVSPQIVCICMATGIYSSEMVEIEWKGASSLSTRNTTRDMDSTTRTFSISSETTLPPLNEGSSLSCSLTGYESQIPESLRSSIYTFTPPVCNLLMQECSSDGRSALLICNCTDGSPAINAYTFYDSEESAIGTQFSNVKSVQVDANIIETLYCSGCNGVMHNPKFVGHEVKCQQGSILWILIIVILIFIFIIVFVAILSFLCVFMKKKDTKVRSRQPGYRNVTQQELEKHNQHKKAEEGSSHANQPTQGDKKVADKNHQQVASAGSQGNNRKKLSVQKQKVHEQVGSDKGHESDSKKAVKKEEPNRTELPSHDRTPADGEENPKVSECPVQYTGSDIDTGVREFKPTDTHEDNHGPSKDSAAEKCPVQFTGSDIDTGAREFLTTNTQGDNHGTSSTSDAKQDKKNDTKPKDNQGNVDDSASPQV